MGEGAAFCSRCGCQVPQTQAQPGQQPAQQAAPQQTYGGWNNEPAQQAALQPNYGGWNNGPAQQAAPAYTAPAYTAPAYAAPAGTAPREVISPAVKKVLIILAAAALGCRLLSMLVGKTPVSNVFAYCIIPLGAFLASTIFMNKAPLALAAAAEVFLTIQDSFNLPSYIAYESVGQVFLILFRLGFAVVFVLELTKRQKALKIVAGILVSLLSAHVLASQFRYQIVYGVFGYDPDAQTVFSSLVFYLYVLAYRAALILLVFSVRTGKEYGTAAYSVPVSGKPEILPKKSGIVILILAAAAATLVMIPIFVDISHGLPAESAMSSILRKVLYPYGFFAAAVLMVNSKSEKVLYIPVAYVGAFALIRLLNLFVPAYIITPWQVIIPLMEIIFSALMIVYLSTEKKLFGFLAAGALLVTGLNASYQALTLLARAMERIGKRNFWRYCGNSFTTGWVDCFCTVAAVVILVLSMKFSRKQN